MLQLLTCARGHFWEAPESEGDAPSRCPECGLPADVYSSPDLAESAPPAKVVRPDPPPVEERGQPVVPGFDILEELPRGPTGIRRFRAKQALVAREVLLEVVLAREDPAQRAWSSLRSEAGLLGKLSHPHILPILEAGERDRQLFYNAVESVAGPTLRKLAGKDLPPVAQTLALVEALARAIDHAHQAGVVHRHLEPAEVLLLPIQGKEGGPAYRLLSGVFIPRITGFGLPRRPVEGDPTDAELYAEHGFLSPEQAWGRTRDMGPATDVYGLGAILYFLLTGRPPFRGPGLSDILDAVQTAPLVFPLATAGLTSDLEAVICKAMARRPDRRYKSAAALADDLRRVARGEAPKAAPASAFGQVGRWMRRQPMAVALILVCLLGLAGMFFTASAARVENPNAGRSPSWAGAELSRLQFEEATLRNRLAVLEQQQQFTAYKERITRAARALAAGEAGQAGALLDGCVEGDRRFEWHYLKRKADGRERVQLEGCEGARGVMAFHPGGAPHLVVANETRDDDPRRGQVQLFHLPNARRTQVQESLANPVQGLAFSPDGQSLAVIAGDTDSELSVFQTQPVGDADVVFGRMRFRNEFRGHKLTGVAWSPTEGVIAVAADSGRVFRVNAHTGDSWGELPQQLQPFRQQGRATRLAYSPDGSQLARFTLGVSDLRVWDTRTNDSREVEDGREGAAMAFTPDGTLAVAGSDGTIHFFRGMYWQQDGFVADPPKGVVQLAFSPDGHRLVMAAADGVHIWGKDGSGWQELLTLPMKGVLGVAFSPDGRALAACGPRQTVVWGAAGG